MKLFHLVYMLLFLVLQLRAIQMISCLIPDSYRLHSENQTPVLEWLNWCENINHSRPFIQMKPARHFIISPYRELPCVTSMQFIFSFSQKIEVCFILILVFKMFDVNTPQKQYFQIILSSGQNFMFHSAELQWRSLCKKCFPQRKPSFPIN